MWVGWYEGRNKIEKIKEALERFHNIVESLECECDDYNGYICTVHSDRVLANEALTEMVFLMYTEHHQSDPEGDATKLITALVRGIEAWAADEDGVHDDCYDAYRRAKFAVGENH